MPYAIYSIEPPTRYAGFWIRWAARLIDSIVLFIILFIVGLAVEFLGVLVGTDLLGPEDVMVSLAAYIMVYWLYYAYLESSSAQATIGPLALCDCTYGWSWGSSEPTCRKR